MTSSRATLIACDDLGATRILRSAAATPQRWTVQRQAADGWVEVVHQVVGDGFFGGDQSTTRIVARTGASVIVRGVAATPLRGRGRSLAATHIRVASGARLIFAPGALIPQAGAAHWSSLTVEVERGASALLFTVVTPGRAAMGERGAFSELRLRTRAFVRSDGAGGSSLAFAEDATFRPDETDIDGPAIFGGADAAISVLHLGDSDSPTPFAAFDGVYGIIGGSGTLRSDGSLYRGLAASLGVATSATECCIREMRSVATLPLPARPAAALRH